MVIGLSQRKLYLKEDGYNSFGSDCTFTLIGILVVAVFLLAAGSFVYFRLYTNLANDTMKFEVLRRIGLTDKEMKKLITRQLLPQFFLPWGLALLHSTVAFIMLQYILKDISFKIDTISLQER